MSDPPYMLPPCQTPRITLSRTPSPVQEGPDTTDALVPGVELIVSKLSRSTVLSATQHLRAILGEYAQTHPSDPLVPLRIVAGDERNPVDYVFLSVDLTVTQEPRPDLLNKVKRVLRTVPGLHVDWKVGRGPDYTRRVHFQVVTFTDAEVLQPKLDEHLNNRGCPFQRSFVSNLRTTGYAETITDMDTGMGRITYDLLDRASVDALQNLPPVIEHRTYYPSVPRFIQPIYGLEVGIAGIGDVQGPKSFIDRYIRRKYGNVIARSRLALNGDAYCIVFETWAQTSRFLADPFTAFDSGFGVTHTVSSFHVHPALLYIHNSNGLPPAAHLSDPSYVLLHNLQAQVDSLQHRVVDPEAIAALAAQYKQTAQLIQDRAQKTAASIAALSTIMSNCSLLQSATSRLQGLQSDSQASRRLLSFIPPDRANAIMQDLRHIDAVIEAQQTAVSQAQESLAAAQQLLPSI